MTASMKVKLIAVGVLVALLGIVLLQNAETVSLKILFWDISMSRILFFPLLFLSGFLTGFFVAKMTVP